MDITRLHSRLYLGPFLCEHGFMGRGVEVGTFRGEFAADLLSKWPGRLICIDPWETMHDHEYLDGCNRANMDQIHQDALVRLATYGDRVELCRMRSADAHHSIPDESLEFVYLDGNHDFPHASEDFENFWPKIRPGGILGMHDCYNRNDDAQRCGVWDVVWEMARTLNQKPHLTHCTSAWFQK